MGLAIYLTRMRTLHELRGLAYFQRVKLLQEKKMSSNIECLMEFGLLFVQLLHVLVDIDAHL